MAEEVGDGTDVIGKVFRVAGKSVQKYTPSPNPFQLNQLQ